MLYRLLACFSSASFAQQNITSDGYKISLISSFVNQGTAPMWQTGNMYGIDAVFSTDVVSKGRLNVVLGGYYSRYGEDFSNENCWGESLKVSFSGDFQHLFYGFIIILIYIYLVNKFLIILTNVRIMELNKFINLFTGVLNLDNVDKINKRY